MKLSAFTQRLSAFTASASLLLIVCIPTTAEASGNATIEFRPHCAGDDTLENKFGGPSPDIKGMMELTEGTCHTFEVRDPSALQTPTLKIGDTLDMDIIITNPSNSAISRFRTWIAYDSTILQGLEITPSSLFPIRTPGESDFITTDGIAKISGSTTSSVSLPKFSVARVRFLVLKDSEEGTPLIFTETTGDSNAKTGVFVGTSPSEQNILSSTIGSLFVRLTGAKTSVSSLNTSSVHSQSSNNDTTTTNGTHDAAITTTSSISSLSSSSSEASKNTGVIQKAFSILQIFGLRVTTEGSSVFLAWDALPSSELAGYNVYYGTVSGRYIQRRSVDKGANSLTLRALPVGTTYYFAVRGYNSANEETTFSQEVGISVGNPKTSTAPLSANALPTKTPETGGNISGETGVTSTMLIIVFCCASVGTIIAMRRQFYASSLS